MLHLDPILLTDIDFYQKASVKHLDPTCRGIDTQTPNWKITEPTQKIPSFDATEPTGKSRTPLCEEAMMQFVHETYIVPAL